MSLDLLLKGMKGTPKEWSKYLEDHGFKESYSGDGIKLYSKDRLDASIQFTKFPDSDYDVSITSYLNTSNQHVFEQEEITKRMAKKFDGTIFDPQEDEVIGQTTSPKWVPYRNSSKYCQEGYEWVPPYYKKNHVFVSGHCRKKNDKRRK